MMTPNKFYRTGLKSLSLTNGRRWDCSFSSLYFTDPCNDNFWWISVLYHLQHCTLKRIHNQGSKRLYLYYVTSALNVYLTIW